MSAFRAIRRRFELVPGQHRPRVARNGAIGLAVLAVLLYAGYSRTIPLWPKGGEVVRAEFGDAANVRGGQEVRMRGVKVGTVEGVERSDRGDSAIVEMRLDEDGRPELRRDASATIYWRTLLGRNMYIELAPGRDPRTLDGATIARDRTRTQVELDQAFEPLDDNGRPHVQASVEAFREGLDGEDAAGEALERTGPALRPLARGLGALRGENRGDLQRVVDRTAKVMEALDAPEGKLASLIDGAGMTLAVTAARRAELASTLGAAPGTLQRARREAVALRGTLDRLDPLVDDARPGVRRIAPSLSTLTPALRVATPVLRDARPLLADLQPAVRRLRSAGRAGTPLVRTLDPTVIRTRDEILPWLLGTDKNTGRKVHQTIGPTFAFLANLTQAFDVNGHDVPFQGGGGLRTLGTLAPCEVLLADPNAEQRIKCDALSEGLSQLLGDAPARRAK